MRSPILAIIWHYEEDERIECKRTQIVYFKSKKKMDSITQPTCWCAGSWCHELLPIWTQGGLQHQSGRVNVIAGWIRVSILTTVCATRMICKGARFWITAVMLRAISTKKNWAWRGAITTTCFVQICIATQQQQPVGWWWWGCKKSIVVVGKSRYALNRIRIMPSRSAKRRNRKLPDWSF